MPSIEELLHRRTDLSTFIVHFTRNTGFSARENLLSILIDGTIRRGRPMGMAAKHAVELRESQPGFFESQQVACFTETPLEHAWMMCEEIEGRDIGFQPYGLAFTKTWARAQGVNPVWYLDISARGIEWLTNPTNRLVEAAIAAANYEHDIFGLTPYMEQMGPTTTARKEFWWEREWRLANRDLLFEPRDVVVVLAPEEDHLSLMCELEERGARNRVVPGYYEPLQYADPRWGLERIVARLAGVPDADAGPLPPA